METDLQPRSKVADFYSDRNIFITGATGFIGKVLVHKLLTACPSIGAIYVLIRPKRGHEPAKRLTTLLEAPIFATVSEEKLRKVRAVEGDITSPKLGLSKDEHDLLAREVSVVFHSAATVKFDEDFSKSVCMNIEGTLAVIDLARKMGSNLASFVHVSTAYSHCYLPTIDEQFYDIEWSPDDILEIAKRIKPSILDKPEFTKMLIGKYPNTYAFTKAVTEQAIREKAPDLPLSIFRPSIVVAAAQEPVPGWIDNLNGPTGLITGYGAGLIRTLRVFSHKRADIIPVDLVVNMMCLIGWKTAVCQSTSMDENLNKSIPLYNFTSGQNRPFTWGDFSVYGKKHTSTYPFEYMLWKPGGTFKDSVIADRICGVFFHYVPAMLVDLVLRLIGKKPFMWKIVSRMTSAMGALEYFATREWSWSNKNVHTLNDELEETDKVLFPADLRSDLPDWDKYILNYFYGVRHYVLKNDPNSIEYCRKKYKVYVALDLLVKGVFLYLLFKFGAYMFL